MAKGINLFLILFSALVFVHQRDKGVFVGAGGYADSAVAYVKPVDSYVNPVGAYVNGVDEAGLSVRDRLREIYMAEVGVRELSGRNDGERVAEYLRYTDLGEGYAWCASFVSWVYGQAGFQIGEHTSELQSREKLVFRLLLE